MGEPGTPHRSAPLKLVGIMMNLPPNVHDHRDRRQRDALLYQAHNAIQRAKMKKISNSKGTCGFRNWGLNRGKA